MSHVFYAGSGGAGKTSCLQIVAEKLGLVVKPSVVRDYCAKHNISTQAEVSAMPEDIRSSFQFDLAQFYIEEVTKFCAEHENTIMDRSIFCHFGYFITASPSASWASIKAFDDLFERFMLFNPKIVYFPYPPSWVLEKKTEDGFRHFVPTKDFLIDAAIFKNMHFYMGNIITAQEMPVEERCDYIIRRLAQESKLVGH
jgi:predicted ATPase